MIEVENPPPDPKERTASDPSPLYPSSDPAAGGIAPVDLRPEPDPCLICGAPMGACTGHEEPPPARDPRRVRVQGTTDANADPGSNVFVCPDDVVEVFESGMPGRSTRKSRRLVHRKGEIITRDRAIQLGLVEGAVSAPAPVPPAAHRTAVGEPVTVPQL